ncbi:MAG: hypothetical protein QF704_16330 [Anaerolineales bacterium]|nr:hypothetical protein [Anaerolineales bacterium]
MSTLETKKIEPLSGTSVTLGAAGDAVTMPAGVTVKTNTVKDAGGNTIWTSDGSGTVSSVNSALQGNMVFISSQTASSSSSVSFTSGIDSTYDEYVFYFVGINPATDSVEFSFQVNATGQSGFNETMTTTWHQAYHYENNSASGFGYHTGYDQAQGTSYQVFVGSLGSGSNECCAGQLHLFSPASTTYVKHFYSRLNENTANDISGDRWSAGYINTTSAITEIDFKMSSGNINEGTIYLYGIK